MVERRTGRSVEEDSECRWLVEPIEPETRLARWIEDSANRSEQGASQPRGGDRQRIRCTGRPKGRRLP